MGFCVYAVLAWQKKSGIGNRVWQGIHRCGCGRQLLTEGRLGEMLGKKYPARHDIRTDKALYDYVLEVKTRFMRSTEPLSKVVFDNSLQIIKKALGTHTTVSRVQGGKLKAKREIRVASLFKTAPPEFLHMIVVHELAHLKEREHNKAFYHKIVSLGRRSLTLKLTHI